MAVLAERRPTADIDMLAQGLPNDLDHTARIVEEILAVECDDGVVYEPQRLKTNAIRDQDAYPGVRVSVPARIDRARALLRVDISVGDPVTPEPSLVSYPGLLGEPFALVGYPPEAVLAEKIVTILDRGELMTRERDWADIYLLAGRLDIDGDVLSASIDAVIAYRGSVRRPLQAAVGDLARIRQPNWAAYVASSGHSEKVPSQLEEIVQAVSALADPVVAGQASGQVWNANQRHWSSSTPPVGQ